MQLQHCDIHQRSFLEQSNIFLRIFCCCCKELISNILTLRSSNLLCKMSSCKKYVEMQVCSNQEKNLKNASLHQLVILTCFLKIAKQPFCFRDPEYYGGVDFFCNFQKLMPIPYDISRIVSQLNEWGITVTFDIHLFDLGFVLSIYYSKSCAILNAI